MSDISREEIDAKLAAVEARTETRFVELSGKIDRVVDSISTFRTDLTRELGAVHKEMETAKGDHKFTRLSIIIAVIGSVLAGVAALWVTQANLLSAFQAGLTVKTEQGPAVKK